MNSGDSLSIMVDRGIRPASEADVGAVAELRAVVLRADPERLGRYDEHRVRRRLRDGFAPAPTWVIEVGGAFAGCVSLRPAEDAHWLEHFYLAPHAQGRGIGGAVLRGLLERCDRDGALVRLNVLQSSPARRCTSGTGSGSRRRTRSTCSWCANRPSPPRPPRGPASPGEGRGGRRQQAFTGAGPVRARSRPGRPGPSRVQTVSEEARRGSFQFGRGKWQV